MTKKEDMQKNMKAKTDQELATLLAETRGQMREMRFSAAGARPKDSSAPKKLRALIARAMTERHARVLRSFSEVG